MSSGAPAKYLYLPLEIVIREHDGKALLAYEAARAGWTVILGPKVALYNIKEQLPEGVFIIKSATPLELQQIRSLKQHGHKVCCLDEEGVVTFKEFIGNNVRYSAETVEELDGLFFWGNKQQEIFTQAFTAAKDRSFVTGNPRVEFWRDFAAAVYKNEADKIREQYGDFVLVPSSFGIGNNVMGGSQGLQLIRDHSGKITKDIDRFMVGQAEQNLIVFKEYLDFLPEILRTFPDTNFVLRPHPSESHAPWQELAAQHPNLHIEYRGAVTPWLLAADVMFHFKSTTSIEAYLMGRKIITYLPPLPPYMARYELELPMAVSVVSTSRETLLKDMEGLINGSNARKAGVLEGVLKEWIFTESNGPSSSCRIVEQIESIAPMVVRDLAVPQKNLKAQVRGYIEGALHCLSGVRGAGSLIERLFGKRVKGYEYGKRKRAGLDIVHTKEVIRVIERSAGTQDNPLEINAFTDDLFVIRKG